MTPDQPAGAPAAAPREAERGPVSRRAVVGLAAVAGLSLAAAGLLGAFGDRVSDPSSFRADGYSRSAVGHHAFLELLRAMGRPVSISRYRTADKAEAGILALLEPRLGSEDSPEQGMAADIRAAGVRVLLVLPKRTAAPDLLHHGWVSDAGLLPLSEPQAVLDAFAIGGTVIRPQASVSGGPLPPPTVDAPQLIRSTVLTPLVGGADGMVAGERVQGGVHVVVLADPDVLATHALGKGRNADLALALLDRLGAPDAPVVVDETLHGHVLRPSLAAELLGFPLVLVTLQGVALVALLAWAALVRFGRPRPSPAPLGAGKALLLANTADLLRAGGHVDEAVAAYLRATREAVLAALPPPGGAEEPGAWLARLEAARGRAGALRRLQERVGRLAGKRRAEHEAIQLARQIHRWREELTHGAHADPG